LFLRQLWSLALPNGLCLAWPVPQPSDLIVILVVAELLELVAMSVVSTMLHCVPGRVLMPGSKAGQVLQHLRDRSEAAQ
jgi:hypothetical protein